MLTGCQQVLNQQPDNQQKQGSSNQSANDEVDGLALGEIALAILA